MKNIVITGFEPFGGSETNTSWEVIKGIQDVHTVLLPVSFAEACRMIRKIAAQKPDAVICVGEAGNRQAVSIERVAVNLMDARIPDNNGFQPTDEMISPGRPAAWFSTLPVRDMLRAVMNAGVPAELSYTAGTYVCNAVFYSLMDEINLSGSAAKGGFIHVPKHGIDTERITEALRKAAECLL